MGGNVNSKNTQTTKTHKKPNNIYSEVIILRIFAILSSAGFMFVHRHVQSLTKKHNVVVKNYHKLAKKHHAFSKRLQLLLGGSIKGFEVQYGKNCTIHSLNNATYWYRRQKGITKQIGSIEFDLINERYYAFTEGRESPKSIFHTSHTNSTRMRDFMRTGFIDGKLRTRNPIPQSLLKTHRGYPLYTYVLYLRKMGVNTEYASTENSFKHSIENAWNKSFVAIMITLEVSERRTLHCVSLRREPQGENMWLYQDSNEPFNQILIHGQTSQKLWDFLQQERYYKSGTRLDFVDCNIIWSD